ncbi:MAG: ATP-dependent Clp protease adaptor ClpS [Bacteroidales bacterium]|nr:ATP-dependent Clp protease adaptor ClpS [Bacteroidales bacterium]
MDVLEKTSHSLLLEDVVGEQRFLVLHNDDVHTFDFVIAALMEVCLHDAQQAEQCAYIVHYRGRCDIKKGSYDFLHPMKVQLIDRGLNVTID